MKTTVILLSAIVALARAAPSAPTASRIPIEYEIDWVRLWQGEGEEMVQTR